MELQRLMSRVRRALDDYHMISEGDRIAVGLSGGKDSITLLYALKHLQRFYPHHFSLCAISVDLGFENFDTSNIRQICEDLDVELKIVKTSIGEIVFDIRKEPNPCALCAKMRKGALNNALLEMGCNKVAYAHHSDDVIETMMMSLFYEGRFSTFSPVTYLEDHDIRVIRPLIYLNESEVIGFINKAQINVTKSPCPADGYTKRAYIKDLIRKINQENPGVKQRIYTAIRTSTMEGWNEDGCNQS